MKTTVVSTAKYILSKIDRALDGITAELSENRAILNWMFSLSYLAMTWYCVINYPTSATTAITVTGGLVSAIFASYVFGQSYERVTRMRLDSANRNTEDTKDDDTESGD